MSWRQTARCACAWPGSLGWSTEGSVVFVLDAGVSGTRGSGRSRLRLAPKLCPGPFDIHTLPCSLHRTCCLILQVKETEDKSLPWDHTSGSEGLRLTSTEHRGRGLRQEEEGIFSRSLWKAPTSDWHLRNGAECLLVLSWTSALSSPLAGWKCPVGLWLFAEAHPWGLGPRQFEFMRNLHLHAFCLLRSILPFVALGFVPSLEAMPKCIRIFFFFKEIGD